MTLISELRSRLGRALISFAWDEWAQLGILASPSRTSPWAQDPEALLLLTFEAARDDPRLFDEVLDWMVHNESLLSVRRLRSLCGDQADRRLTAAALEYVARYRHRQRLTSSASDNEWSAPEPLFRGLPTQPGETDETFAAHGFLRPRTGPSGKSRAPDLTAPISFAIRIRQLMGIGSRAEVVRYLLTTTFRGTNAETISRSAGISRRNIQEALTALHLAGVVRIVSEGTDQRYALERPAWSLLLDLESSSFPLHRDWPQLLWPLRRILRWLDDAEMQARSAYLLASATRDLLDEVGDDLRYAGVAVDRSDTVAGAWNELEQLTLTALELLEPADQALPTGAGLQFVQRPDQDGHWRWWLASPHSDRIAGSVSSFASQAAAETAAMRFQRQLSRSRTEVLRGGDGQYRWRIRSPNGEIIARSETTFPSSAHAQRGADLARGVAVPRRHDDAS